MYGNAMSAGCEGGLSGKSMDELMKLATEGPIPNEERWRDERERQAQQEVANLHARINALTEIVRRLAHQEHGPAIPMGGQHMSVGARIVGEAVETGEPVRYGVGEVAAVLAETASRLLTCANSLAAVTDCGVIGVTQDVKADGRAPIFARLSSLAGELDSIAKELAA